MPEFQTVLYEHVTPAIVRISLNRPERRNAQNTQLLYDLNDAFDAANIDNDVKVIILAGEGPSFSSGHDLRRQPGDAKPGDPQFRVVGHWANFDLEGAEGGMAREEEMFLNLTRRWRNIPKPVIAEVQGAVVAAGLMLMWACDIIVCSDDAYFQDLVVGWGMPGVEYFAHPWEFGHRKAREMLYTGDPVNAEDAFRLGMVNHVVPRAELRAKVEEIAGRIADKPLFGLKLTKEAINQAQDADGQWTALQSAFTLHTLAHAHWRETQGTGMYTNREGAPPMPGSRRS